MVNKCERCGLEFRPGVGRYILTMSFVADVDFELSLEEGSEGDIGELLEEIERTPEEELVEQVYQKRAFLICRACKEELGQNPFGNALQQSETFQ